MLDSLTPILVALTAAALIIAGTRTPASRPTERRNDDGARRRRDRQDAAPQRDDTLRFVAVRNAWDRADLARAIGTDNAAPEFTVAPRPAHPIR